MRPSREASDATLQHKVLDNTRVGGQTVGVAAEQVNTSGTTRLGVLILLLLAGGLVLVALFGLATRDVRAPRGAELRCEDIGFRVLDFAATQRVGAPGSERSASGLYRIVRLEVANQTHDGDYDLAWHHALLMDES